MIQISISCLQIVARAVKFDYVVYCMKFIQKFSRVFQHFGKTFLHNFPSQSFSSQNKSAHWRMFRLNTMIYSNIIIKSNLFVIIFHGSTPRRRRAPLLTARYRFVFFGGRKLISLHVIVSTFARAVETHCLMHFFARRPLFIATREKLYNFVDCNTRWAN